MKIKFCCKFSVLYVVVAVVKTLSHKSDYGGGGTKEEGKRRQPKFFETTISSLFICQNEYFYNQSILLI